MIESGSSTVSVCERRQCFLDELALILDNFGYKNILSSVEPTHHSEPTQMSFLPVFDGDLASVENTTSYSHGFNFNHEMIFRNNCTVAENAIVSSSKSVDSDFNELLKRNILISIQNDLKSSKIEEEEFISKLSAKLEHRNMKQKLIDIEFQKLLAQTAIHSFHS
jgi:hypothetical protein